MSGYKGINNIVGWLVFAIATAVYALTVEPTASFWDCGEFIAVSYKLMVPHPPGAPLFLLVGRLFSLLASDPTRVAFWVNMVSVLSSSFTVLFLFWSITMLAKKLAGVENGQSPSLGQTIAIMGSGVVGALAYTFSDSAWFSAEEAEVYAMSSFFTALVVWAMLKWEAVADEPDADRWLVFIAYMTGLSIGVHLLNLVTVPALAYIYYFRKYKPTTKGMIITMVIGMAIVGIVLVGVIPGLPSLAGSFEIFFVNTLGMPFNSGIIFFVLAFVGALTYAIIYSIRKQNRMLNTSLVAFVFVLIGYASYGIIVIRANFHTPINENNPDNVISFVSYLKREQYGDRPLLYGPLYNAQPVKQEKGAPVYARKGNRYEIIEYKTINVYASKDKTLLPRIYSPQGNHVQAYRNWVKDLPPSDVKPSFAQNMEFMFKYQIGWMYVRYFMWNFAGRESDIQDADWLSPFASKAGLPDSLANNRGRNNFYMLPLILGLIGLYYQLKRNGRSAFVVGLLFIFTGIAIVVYLNQPPVEPRERDYTFAGSFYTFSIWIGLGVLALWDYTRRMLKNDTVSAVAMSAISFVAPALMLQQGWDDHNRADRFHSVDSARNLLNSCAPNAILFTGGDNDTFPLWYVQEVEGFRTDVRVCNLSLLGTDWYISQMKQKAYESQPLPISLEEENFTQGKNDYIPYVENPNVKGAINLKQYMSLVKQNHPAIMVQAQSGSSIASLISKSFFLPVDSAKVAAMGIVPKGKENQIVSNIAWDLNKTALFKNDLLVLDMIATNNWERPIYFSTTLSPSSYLNLKPYFQLEGLAYRLVPAKLAENDLMLERLRYEQGQTKEMPFTVSNPSEGYVNTDIMYNNMMTNRFQWRGLDNPSVYYDENYKRFPLNSRNSFYRLAAQLYNEGKQDKAKQVIDYCFKVIPDNTIPYDVYIPQFLPLMLRLGEEKRAIDIAETLHNRTIQELDYYTKSRPNAQQEIQTNIYMLQQLFMAFKNAGKNEQADKYEKTFMKYYQFAQPQGGYEEE
ncbi:Protein of unknown function [Flexibacter flexilis DSM 6793]|uniref:DUF2723 domain-containing protein n=1 Tax=Flexibacter flexilis DSM 6793 TaxID=927664 RepID=A0A1I1KLQ1_9BACT|nr:DUF2723 domain-containing protein [Flexibacter flexilis]SFC61717.1 Protein of unknown function [Flexibacter flexilis DSM 6793]